MRIIPVQQLHFLSRSGILIALAAVALHACSPDPPDCLETKYSTKDITPQEHAAVPYSGTDTLRFLTETGDTNVFIGSGKTYFYEQYAEPNDRPGCPPLSVSNNQSYRVQYISTKQQMNFELTLSTGENSGKYVGVVLHSTQRSFKLNASWLLQQVKPIPIDTNFYLERITLLGTEYTNVSKSRCWTMTVVEKIDSLGYMLYNKEEGIIQLKYDTKLLTKIK